MTEQENKILDTFRRVFPKLNDKDKDRLFEKFWCLRELFVWLWFSGLFWFYLLHYGVLVLYGNRLSVQINQSFYLILL